MPPSSPARAQQDTLSPPQHGQVDGARPRHPRPASAPLRESPRTQPGPWPFFLTLPLLCHCAPKSDGQSNNTSASVSQPLSGPLDGTSPLNSPGNPKATAPGIDAEKNITANNNSIAAGAAAGNTVPPPSPASPASASATRIVQIDAINRQTDGLHAFHRRGQTFITFPEKPDQWHVLYRSLTPITSLEGLDPIALIPPNSGTFQRSASLPDAHQRRFILHADGPELADGLGLYVHTPHAPTGTRAYYAVAPAQDPTAYHSALSLAQPVTEGQEPIEPLLIRTGPGGGQRLYTFFMDDTRFSPQPQGLAFNLWVGVPPGSRAETRLPLTVHLHAWGESWLRFFGSSPPEAPGSPYGFPSIWLEQDDPGNTWWLGALGTPPGPPSVPGWRERARSWLQAREAASFLDSGPLLPRTDTNDRLELTLQWLMSGRAGVSVDPERVYLYGGSMGGSGTLTFGLRHPEQFAALYALAPMTRPATSVWAREGLTRLWGDPLRPPALPNGMSLYQLADMQGLIADASQELPLTVTVHGRKDTIIEWSSQGRPWLEARQASALPGPALFTDGGHSEIFDSFGGALVPNFAPSTFQWRRSESFPVFTRFSGDDGADAALPACRHPDPLYRYGYQGGGVEWGGGGHAVLGQVAPIETPTTYGLTMKIREDVCQLPKNGTTNITLRRRQHFKPSPGQVIVWEVKKGTGERIKGGELKVEKGALLLRDIPVSQEPYRLELRLKAASKPSSKPQ